MVDKDKDKEYNTWFRNMVLKRVALPVTAVAIAAGLYTLYVSDGLEGVVQAPPTPTPIVEPHIRSVYVIVSGDNVRRVVGKTHIGIDSLKAYNPGYNFGRMHRGDTLYTGR